MRNNYFFIFFLGFFLIAIFSSFFPWYVVSTDVLSYFPSFSDDHWIRVHNSLLADPVFQFEPWRVHLKEQILQGDFPLWNPLNGFGAPFFANMQSAVLYPLSWLYILLPLPMSLIFIFLLKVYIFGFFTYMYLKKVGCRKMVSLIGSLCASSLGFVIVWVQWPQTNVFILFPVLLYLAEWTRSEKKRKYLGFSLISVVYCTALFGGHPETLFHLTIIYLLYLALRLFPDVLTLLRFFISVIVGVLLGTIQLLPFLEYIQNSAVFFERSNVATVSSLPVRSFILNVFPYIFGAPHTEFYRPIAQYTNFQETISGYTGVIVFLVSVLGLWRLRKQRLAMIWVFSILTCLSLAYNIFPFSFINQLPLFNVSANARLIGFSGFGFCILFALVLQALSERKVRVTHLLPVPVIVLCCMGFIATFFSPYLQFLPMYQPQYHTFFVQLTYHVQLILIATVVFFVLLIILSKRNKLRSRWILILWIPIAFQTVFLLGNYNTFTKRELYYPSTRLTKELRNLPKGVVLEVGNPSLPQNSNIVYSISQAENYDAIEVKAYAKQFDEYFDINHLGNVDSISPVTIRKSGVTYIVSDYDLRLKKVSVQPKKQTILPNILPERPTRLAFVAKDSSLKAIRLITANYNRRNTCQLFVSLSNNLGILKQSQIDCKDIRDGMFFSLPFVAELEEGGVYSLSVSSKDASESNSISLWGNTENEPFVELLYESREVIVPLTLLSKTKTSYIWEVTNQSFVQGARSFRVISRRPESMSVAVHMGETGPLTILMTKYPGWNVTIDGLPAEIESNDAFIGLVVPKGQHIVTLSYQPQSFYVGLGVSLVTGLFLVVYVLRAELHQQRWKDRLKRWNAQARKIAKHTSITEHILVITTSTATGVVIYLAIWFLLLPKSLPLEQTTALNWLVLTGHSLTLDYIRFMLFVVVIFVVSVTGWGIWIWKKGR